MNNERLHEFFSPESAQLDHLIRLYVSSGERLRIYPNSIHECDGHYFFIARSAKGKHLYIIHFGSRNSLTRRFPCSIIDSRQLEANTCVTRCTLDEANAGIIQELFPFTRPQTIGVVNSFGFGDRLGVAGPGHIRAVRGTGFVPVLAQQSIRELDRTGRTPGDVMAAAVWAVFQEGWREPFGADADHLKTTEDIDRMVQAGYTMFTLDLGEAVQPVNTIKTTAQLTAALENLPWDCLETTRNDLLGIYPERYIRIGGHFTIRQSRRQFHFAMVKYGRVIARAAELYRHLKTAAGNRDIEVELSLDETDTPLTSFEHYMVVNELKRLGVPLTSVAPRFAGSFEKGVDYRGKLTEFRYNYLMHSAIAQTLGPYKISLHSGSDKFSIYSIIADLDMGPVHVKTAGTSYLVALRAAAVADPSLLRTIYRFSWDWYERERRSYHVSAELEQAPEPDSLFDDNFDGLFENDNARQILHVAFGRVLTAWDDKGRTCFRERLLACLDEHEEEHYRLLGEHFDRHLRPFIRETKT